MTLATRISKMEQIIGASGDNICRCPHAGPGTVVWPDGSRSDYGPCRRCGRQRPTCHVKYDGYDPKQELIGRVEAIAARKEKWKDNN
jgi:hypothetical protein